MSMPTQEELIERARKLVPVLAERAQACEELRRLPDETVQDFQDAGFYDICKMRGLTGKQGCIIPEVNVKNLVLRQDIVDAIEQNQFSIYPVTHFDEALEILTDQIAGDLTLKIGRAFDLDLHHRFQQRGLHL